MTLILSFSFHVLQLIEACFYLCLRKHGFHQFCGDFGYFSFFRLHFKASFGSFPAVLWICFSNSFLTSQKYHLEDSSTSQNRWTNFSPYEVLAYLAFLRRSGLLAAIGLYFCNNCFLPVYYPPSFPSYARTNLLSLSLSFLPHRILEHLLPIYNMKLNPKKWYIC